MRNFNQHLKEVEDVESFEDLTNQHVEGDNLERVLALFHGKKVPYKDSFLLASAKVIYATKIKEALKAKFWDNTFWEDVENWKKLLKNFTTRAERTDQQGGYGTEPKALPIFKDISELPYGTVLLKDLGVICYDLKSIVLELLKEKSKIHGEKILETNRVNPL